MKATVVGRGKRWRWSNVKNDCSKNWLVMTEWSSLNNKGLIDAGGGKARQEM